MKIFDSKMNLHGAMILYFKNKQIHYYCDFWTGE